MGSVFVSGLWIMEAADSKLVYKGLNEDNFSNEITKFKKKSSVQIPDKPPNC